jgi:F0F1-type ATP synthase membrane subunit b/b'
MSETITQLGTLLAIPTAALFAAVWIGYRLIVQRDLYKARQLSEEARRRLTDIESSLRNLQSKVAAMEAMFDRESIEQRVRETVEKLRIVEAAEREILAAVSAVNPDFRGYTSELAVTLAANRVRVDDWTDEALLRSFVDQLGPRGSN